ncbi:hypothetical protein PENVUL_c008G05105 [Penicillium vulpinum]|uniref:Plectin/eS10 N-terminal domain-containing protein n=1 Tax=Penicillium vulpinum TaxID=29845 RepID=A0A1V6S5F3_9EURO|nr:hypothetical protein PENVUL_c008G05105 [Penicillium vulpinum]
MEDVAIRLRISRRSYDDSSLGEAPLFIHHLNQPLFPGVVKAIPRLAPGTRDNAYPQRRPQEDPRVPLPWYVTRTLVDVPATLRHRDTALVSQGVLVAKKDFNLPKHGDIDTKNLYVIKALQSLDSRGFVKTQFSWQYYYYTLTPEGLDYLREWLHLPAEVVPATHIKQQRSHAPPRGMMGGEEQRGERRGPREGGRGGREGGYRRREEGGKEGGPPGEFAPSFRGGFGRGRGAAPQE